MVKPVLSIFALLTLLSGSLQAQVWSYDFGTAVDSINTSVVKNSPDLMPIPPDGTSTARARVGTGAGRIVLKNYPFIGSGSALRIAAPTNTSVNKFSIHNIQGATSTFGLKISFSVGDSVNAATGVTGGNFYLFAGNGATYSDNTAFNGTQVFTGVRISCVSPAPTLAFRIGGTWITSPLTLTYGTVNNIIMYMNNSVSTISYTDINGTVRSLAADSWDLFSNNIYLTTLGKAALPTGTTINSFMFYGESSPANAASAFLDNIVYTNDITTNVLSVKLAAFQAKAQGSEVKLSWKTETEDGMDRFEVEHSVNGSGFVKIGETDALGLSGSDYAFLHTNPEAVNFYRLRMVKQDGSFEFSPIISAKVSNMNRAITAWYSHERIYLANHAGAQVDVFDVSGKKVFSAIADASVSSVELPQLPEGSYIARITDGSRQATVRFIKL